MKKIATLAICALLCIVSYAQKNLKEGYVVLNSGDTVRGFIDYREWYKNPVTVLFSATRDGGRQTYRVKDISGFAVNGLELYQRYVVRISMDRATIGNIGEKDTSSRTDTVLLRVIEKGNNVTLFSYADDIKKRLYLLPVNEATPIELQHSEYISDGQVIKEKEYQSVLLNVATKYGVAAGDIQELLYREEFSQKTITGICDKINGIAHSAASAKQTDSNKPSAFRLFAGIGINRGLISIGEGNHYAGKTDGAHYAPLIDAGADILFTPAIGKLFLRSQLVVSGYKSSAYTFVKYFEAKENYYFTFKQQNIALHEQLLYNLYNGKTVKWFAGVGGGFNFSSYSKNEEKLIREGLSDTTTRVNEKYLFTIKNFWLNTIIKTGVTISNLDIAIAYLPKASISQTNVASIYSSSLQLQVNYLFKK